MYYRKYANMLVKDWGSKWHFNFILFWHPQVFLVCLHIFHNQGEQNWSERTSICTVIFEEKEVLGFGIKAIPIWNKSKSEKSMNWPKSHGSLRWNFKRWSPVCGQVSNVRTC